MAGAYRRIPCTAGVLALLFPTAGFAQDLPAALKDFLREANDSERKSIENVAKRLYPDKREKIDDLVDDIEDEEKAEVAKSSIAVGWRGEGSIGANWSQGNTDQLDVSLSFDAKRKSPRWEHRITTYVDLTSNDGERTTERLGLSYRIRRDYQNSPWFIFGGASFERDRFQGIDRRFTEIAGVGHQIIDTDETDWEATIGPALRQSRFTDNTNENRLGIAFGTDFEHELTDTLKVRERATVVLDEQNKTFYSVTSLISNIYGRLSGSISFTFDLESDPPAGSEQLDTYAKASLVIEM